MPSAHDGVSFQPTSPPAMIAPWSLRTVDWTMGPPKKRLLLSPCWAAAFGAAALAATTDNAATSMRLRKAPS